MAAKLQVSPGQRRNPGETVVLAFFEASTRTRLSFESAAHRAGLAPVIFESGRNTSLEKGETIEDSLLNIAAMMPKALVVRCGDAVPLREISRVLSVPVINAGWGIHGHPTQALLDAFTLQKAWGSLQGKRLLVVGDLIHSRVIASHLELAPKIGLELGQCGPRDFLLREGPVKSFSYLSEGLAWADAVMALRFQFERHKEAIAFSQEAFRVEFGLNRESVKNLKPEGLILHPGPINHGIEIETEILKDPRCKVLEQVQNGVFVRESLLRLTLGEQV